MGRDKARVEVEGEPMALRVARALREGGVEPVTLVGKDPQQASLGLPFLHEVEADHHPLHGLVSGLRHAASSGHRCAFFSPCDLAWLSKESVARLLASGGPCCARAGDQQQPLLALLSVELADELERAARAGLSVYAALAHLPRVEVEPDSLRNVNRPEDIPAS
mgnify:CR=1 FL=1